MDGIPDARGMAARDATKFIDKKVHESPTYMNSVSKYYACMLRAASTARTRPQSISPVGAIALRVTRKRLGQGLQGVCQKGQGTPEEYGAP